MRGYYVPPFLRFSCTHGRGGVYATVEARVRGPYTVGGGEWDTIHRAFRREAVGRGNRNDTTHWRTRSWPCIRFHAIETIPASIYNGQLLIGRWLIAVT